MSPGHLESARHRAGWWNPAGSVTRPPGSCTPSPVWGPCRPRQTFPFFLRRPRPLLPALAPVGCRCCLDSARGAGRGRGVLAVGAGRGPPRSPRGGAGSTAQAPWAAAARDAAIVSVGLACLQSLHLSPHLVPAACPSATPAASQLRRDARLPCSPGRRPRGPGSLSWAEGTPAPRRAVRAAHVGPQGSCRPRGRPPTRQPRAS